MSPELFAWPRIVFSSFIGELRHHFKLSNGCTAVTDRGADTVVTCIAAADYDHILVLGGDENGVLAVLGKPDVLQHFEG